MIRFYNGTILTMDGAAPTARELWTKGDTIAYIGETPAALPAFEREIDLKGDLLMPGFKNAHTHSPMTFLRSFADDLPLLQWLETQVFPREARLREEHVYWLTKLAIAEYLTSGVTASFDMYTFHDAYVSANIDCGFRTVLCGSINAATERPEILEDAYRKFNAVHPLISYQLGFHAEYTIGKHLGYVQHLAEKYKAPIYTHNSETAPEVADCLARTGMSPTQFLDSQGIFAYGGGGFHCVHVTDADLEIFKKRGMWIVTNPASNAKLASGIAPLTKMMDMGIGLAIGTDGPASNNALDMFREMYLACVMQKLANKDAAACDADAVLRMATSGGAHCMGIPNCDCLAVGKQADMIIIDLHRPNMQPVLNLTKNLVYSGSKENVRMTMVAGKVLYENGAFFLGDSIETIYAQCKSAVQELLT
ncbi:MAG: amidohydrolase [Oscillospiraceae bacterium]|jgi:5-methylthioadenosine/S-adenosylhomocysteine deaminase|nr:amidohydrolase [Oscillospiraceae bacterium]